MYCIDNGAQPHATGALAAVAGTGEKNDRVFRDPVRNPAEYAAFERGGGVGRGGVRFQTIFRARLDGTLTRVFYFVFPRVDRLVSSAKIARTSFKRAISFFRSFRRPSILPLYIDVAEESRLPRTPRRAPVTFDSVQPANTHNRRDRLRLRDVSISRRSVIVNFDLFLERERSIYVYIYIYIRVSRAGSPQDSAGWRDPVVRFF